MSGALAMLLGSAVPSVTVTIAPLSIDASAAASSFTFGACTITTAGGTPSSYTWSIVDPQFGTWFIVSGQGTASAVAEVVAVLGQDTATCDFTCAVVVGSQTFTRASRLSFYNTSDAP